MYQLIVLIVLNIALTNCQEANEELPVIKCVAVKTNLETHTFTCNFVEKFSLNESHPYFQVVSTPGDPEIQANISDIRLQSQSKTKFDDKSVQGEAAQSKMHTFTNNFCLSFPNVRAISALNLGLTVVHENAFENCVNLHTIYLSHNNLTQIAPKTFLNNKNLYVINLSYNNIVEIDFKIFENLTILHELSLESNHLKSVKFVNLKNLQLLYLSSNNLTDLDVDDILLKFPSLKALYFKPNHALPYKGHFYVEQKLRENNFNCCF